MKEKNFYEKIKDWDFSMINCEEESLTDWSMSEILRNNTDYSSVVLDLGTAGGERVLEKFPEVREILGTDFSEEMIKTANENLEKSGRKNITFRVMDNLHMDTPGDYFDVVVAKHTPTDPKQIYAALKKGGLLIIRGVDKMDCWALKRIFGKGQGYRDVKTISQIDYENVLDAGFRDVELVPIHTREYFKTREDLVALLLKTPIIDDFSEEENDHCDYYKNEIDIAKLDEYIDQNTYPKGILLLRRYYGIVAKK